jgi:gamma-glutamyltranspeptidase
MSGAIATPHILATRVGKEAFDAGGNAIDAALAAAATLTVVYPHQCTLGGDLFALINRPDGKTFQSMVPGLGRPLLMLLQRKK